MLGSIVFWPRMQGLSKKLRGYLKTTLSLIYISPYYSYIHPLQRPPKPFQSICLKIKKKKKVKSPWLCCYQMWPLLAIPASASSLSSWTLLSLKRLPQDALPFTSFHKPPAPCFLFLICGALYKAQWLIPLAFWLWLWDSVSGLLTIDS